MGETYLYLTESELLSVARGEKTFSEMLLLRVIVLQNNVADREDQIRDLAKRLAAPGSKN